MMASNNSNNINNNASRTRTRTRSSRFTFYRSGGILKNKVQNEKSIIFRSRIEKYISSMKIGLLPTLFTIPESSSTSSHNDVIRKINTNEIIREIIRHHFIKENENENEDKYYNNKQEHNYMQRHQYQRHQYQHQYQHHHHRCSCYIPHPIMIYLRCLGCCKHIVYHQQQQQQQQQGSIHIHPQNENDNSEQSSRSSSSSLSVQQQQSQQQSQQQQQQRKNLNHRISRWDTSSASSNSSSSSSSSNNNNNSKSQRNTAHIISTVDANYLSSNNIDCPPICPVRKKGIKYNQDTIIIERYQHIKNDKNDGRRLQIHTV
jgi:hypothetical protein